MSETLEQRRDRLEQQIAAEAAKQGKAIGSFAEMVTIHRAHERQLDETMRKLRKKWAKKQRELDALPKREICECSIHEFDLDGHNHTSADMKVAGAKMLAKGYVLNMDTLMWSKSDCPHCHGTGGRDVKE